MKVENFLETSAERSPDKVALICGADRLTYGEIEQRSNRLAHALVACGCEPGDRVAIALDNSVQAVVAIFAALKAGCVFVTVNPGIKEAKLTYILNNSRARVLLAQGRNLAVVGVSRNHAPHLKKVVFIGRYPLDPKIHGAVSLDDFTGEFSHSPIIKRTSSTDLATLMYTSGSTGFPKGVMLTHRNIVFAATCITQYLENSADDVILDVLPISFDYGLYQIFMAFEIGATAVLEKSFAYPHAVLEKAVEEGITGFPIVPTISAILLRMDLAKYDLSRLRYITNTGAALPTRHICKLREWLPHVKIYSMYGLTECKRVSYLSPDQIDIRPASVGKAMPDTEVRIVDEEGKSVGPTVVGELVVSGPHVMAGYWEMPDQTDKVLKDDPHGREKVLYTGDLFSMDEEGYLYFVGRKDDLIKTRGEKVSPKEIENVLYEIEGVVEAAIVAVPDEILGHAIKAVITLEEGACLTQQDILRHCAQRLEAPMTPKWVEFRRELPKTSSGKIDKQELMSETNVASGGQHDTLG